MWTLMSSIIFTLIMRKILIRALKNMRQMVTDMILKCQSSRANSMFCILYFEWCSEHNCMNTYIYIYLNRTENIN